MIADDAQVVPDPRIGRRQLQRFAVAGFCPIQPAHVVQVGATVADRRRPVGPALQRFEITRLGLVAARLVLKHVAEMKQRYRLVGRARNRLAQDRFCLGELARRVQRDTMIGERFDIVVIRLDCLARRSDRFVRTSQQLQRDAQHFPAKTVFRKLLRHGRCQFFECLVTSLVKQCAQQIDLRRVRGLRSRTGAGGVLGRWILHAR